MKLKAVLVGGLVCVFLLLLSTPCFAASSGPLVLGRTPISTSQIPVPGYPPLTMYVYAGGLGPGGSGRIIAITGSMPSFQAFNRFLASGHW